MTFLAVTPSIYEAYQDIIDIVDLTERFSLIINNRELSVKNLQLVALPNKLLLAGIPDRGSASLKQTFWNDLMSTDWQSKLHERYPGKALPPDFWHTTILRYKSKNLLPLIREHLLPHLKNRHFEVEDKLKLVLVQYEWGTFLNVI